LVGYFKNRIETISIYAFAHRIENSKLAKEFGSNDAEKWT